MAVYSIPEIRKVVAKLGQEYGAQRIYLFGSAARGDANDASDIDLRIDKGAIRGWNLAGLLLALEDMLNCHVDLVPTGSLDPAFLAQIAQEEVLLYEASPS